MRVKEFSIHNAIASRVARCYPRSGLLDPTRYPENIYKLFSHTEAACVPLTAALRVDLCVAHKLYMSMLSPGIAEHSDDFESENANMNANKRIVAACHFFIAAGATAATFREAEPYASLNAAVGTLKRESN